jgi:methylenetetrahydrofolate dehydrogenase (NADP+)/methenyltetrahydrofolate cyclohydrolase
MTAKILDGQRLSAQIFSTLKQKIVALSSSVPKPKLVIVQVLGDAASNIYVQRKLATAKKIGIQAEHIIFPPDVSSEAVEHTLLGLNQNTTVHGILLQLPLPPHLSEEYLLNLINPKKDVDGLTAVNLGYLVQKKPRIVPCTAAGIIRLLKHYEICLVSQSVVILNASKLVGRPLAMQMLAEGATVTLCNSKTKNNADHVRRADIVVSATGMRHAVSSDWLTPGVIVVDVGVHRNLSSEFAGDFDWKFR